MPEDSSEKVAELAESLAVRATIEGFSQRRIDLVKRAVGEWKLGRTSGGPGNHRHRYCSGRLSSIRTASVRMSI